MTQTKVTSDLITSVDASKLTGSLPASMSEITKQSSDPTVSSPATPTLGDMILNTSTGKLFVCTTVASGANVWQAGVEGSVMPTYNVDYLVIAGGGSGGTENGGGGGGAGG